jgi:hypothetical protein
MPNRRAEGATEWTEQPNGLNLIRQLALPICKSTLYHTLASVLDGTVVDNSM